MTKAELVMMLAPSNGVMRTISTAIDQYDKPPIPPTGSPSYFTTTRSVNETHIEFTVVRNLDTQVPGEKIILLNEVTPMLFALKVGGY